MSIDRTQKEGTEVLLMGNEAIARGALEAGVRVAAGYPGTPSSEIIETLSRFAEAGRLYVEWSTNEKVAMEVAAAASFAGLRSLCVMKQNGVNVASDFLLHLTGSGTRGGMVLVTCDDPGALSSVNEGESRHFARLMEIPLLEPADFQEAKEMTRWAFALSEEIRNIVMVRSVTRMSHASGNVVLGALPPAGGKAEFLCDGPISDPERGPMISAPVVEKHRLQQEKIRKAVATLREEPLQHLYGTGKAGAPDHHEQRLHPLQPGGRLAARAPKDRVGILKLGTTWPIPPALLKRHLSATEKVLIVEEVLPFLEEQVKILAAEQAREIGIKTFYGKNDGTLPMAGELNPDLVAAGRRPDPGNRTAGGSRRPIGEKLRAFARSRTPARADLLPGLSPPRLLLEHPRGAAARRPRRIRLRGHRLLCDGVALSRRRVSYRQDPPCDGFGDRAGIGIRQAGSVRHGPAGDRRLRGFDLLPCGHSRADQRRPSEGEHHLHRPRQQRYGDDGIPVPPRDRGERHGGCRPDGRYRRPLQGDGGARS